MKLSRSLKFCSTETGHSEAGCERENLWTVPVWNAYIVLCRHDPLTIHVSKMVVRDPPSADILNAFGPGRLMFATLLTAGRPELKGFVRKAAMFLPPRRARELDKSRAAPGGRWVLADTKPELIERNDEGGGGGGNVRWETPTPLSS